MHYPLRWYGYGRSRVDGAAFFFSEHGKTRPDLEFAASWKALQENQTAVGYLQQRPRCAFAARREFFAEIHPELFKVEATDCHDFEHWRKGMSPRSVVLVFSSAYPYNPASAFGHSFLRFDSEAFSGSSDLLQYGVSYEAKLNDQDRSFAYVYKAIVGGYPGQFAIAPYYMKVREYNDFEGRDLWEFSLSLNSQETDYLLKLIWELFTTSHADYFFQDENCSFMLLELLDAVRPSWQLTQGISWPVIPAEAVRLVIQTPGLVNAAVFRPSQKRLLIERVEALDSEERRQFEALRSDDKDTKVWETSGLKVLMAYQESLLLKKNKYRADPSSEAIDRSLHRIQARIASQSIGESVRTNATQPYQSAVSLPLESLQRKKRRRIDGQVLWLEPAESKDLQSSIAERASFSFFSDDVLDRHETQKVPVSWTLGSLSVLHRKKTTDKKSMIFIDEIVLADLLSAEPYRNYAETQASMRYRIYMKQELEPNDDLAKVLHGDFGLGYGLDLGAEFLLFAMAGGRLSLSNASHHQALSLPFWFGVIRASATSPWRFSLRSEYALQIRSQGQLSYPWNVNWELRRYFGVNLALSQQASWGNLAHQKEISLGVLKYF